MRFWFAQSQPAFLCWCMVLTLLAKEFVKARAWSLATPLVQRSAVRTSILSVAATPKRNFGDKDGEEDKAWFESQAEKDARDKSSGDPPPSIHPRKPSERNRPRSPGGPGDQPIWVSDQEPENRFQPRKSRPPRSTHRDVDEGRPPFPPPGDESLWGRNQGPSSSNFPPRGQQPFNSARPDQQEPPPFSSEFSDLPSWTRNTPPGNRPGSDPRNRGAPFGPPTSNQGRPGQSPFPPQGRDTGRGRPGQSPFPPQGQDTGQGRPGQPPFPPQGRDAGDDPWARNKPQRGRSASDGRSPFPPPSDFPPDDPYFARSAEPGSRSAPPPFAQSAPGQQNYQDSGEPSWAKNTDPENPINPQKPFDTTAPQSPFGTASDQQNYQDSGEPSWAKNTDPGNPLNPQKPFDATAPDQRKPYIPNTSQAADDPSWMLKKEKGPVQPRKVVPYKRPAATDDSEPPTGWLHNTEAKARPKPRQQQQAPQSQGGPAPINPSAARRLLETAKMKQELNHRIIAPPAFHACGDGRQVVVTEHVISLPIFRGQQDSTHRIDVYFSITEQVKPQKQQFWKYLQAISSPQERADAYVEHASMTNAQDMILYLQGGPGFGAAAPQVGLGMSSDASWAGKALSHYKRIVLMDQRGTGRSTPITKQTLHMIFPDLFLLDSLDVDQSKSISDFESADPQKAQRVRVALTAATDYMAQFRADSIVQDAEDIKNALMLPGEDEEPRPWGAALGQSFGGFCMMTYLSQVAHPPKICLLTGGIAPMLTPTDEAYSSLWERVKERSLKYYEMYPWDIVVVKRIVKRLLEKPVVLPSGGMLTARRFLSLGLGLGGSPSAFASFHSLLSTACVANVEGVEFTRAFLKRIDSEQSFDDHPLYFLMHESIYGDGRQNSPTNWSAHRMYENLVNTPSDFDYRVTSMMDTDESPTLFFGEMVFPWMADGDFAEVSGLGMRSLAHSLASKRDWGPLYDGDHMRKVLHDGSISKAAAAVYLDDMYVDFNACMKVTKRGGPLEKCKVWVTNEYQHSGLRDDGANIFTKLYGMATGSIRTPS